MQDYKKIYTENLGISNVKVFLVVRKEYWNLLQQFMVTVPFQTVMVDPATTEGHNFVESIIELNESAYGKGMAAPAWTFANFGTIGAGITGGILVDDKPISKFSIVGDVMNPDVAHEWTLLTHPDFQGKGLGKLTVALALQAAVHKKYHTFIMQTDNTSNLVYLKNPHPLQVLAYGFIHTKRNSFLIKTQIPSNPFYAFMDNEKKDYKPGEILNDGDMWVKSTDHEQLLAINKNIENGTLFIIKDWVKGEDGVNHILLNKNGK